MVVPLFITKIFYVLGVGLLLPQQFPRTQAQGNCFLLSLGFKNAKQFAFLNALRVPQTLFKSPPPGELYYVLGVGLEPTRPITVNGF